MKKADITPRPSEVCQRPDEGVTYADAARQAAQHIVDHAAWQKSRGRGPSEPFYSLNTLNPVKALSRARRILRAKPGDEGAVHTAFRVRDIREDRGGRYSEVAWTAIVSVIQAREDAGFEF